MFGRTKPGNRNIMKLEIDRLVIQDPVTAHRNIPCGLDSGSRFFSVAALMNEFVSNCFLMISHTILVSHCFQLKFTGALQRVRMRFLTLSVFGLVGLASFCSAAEEDGKSAPPPFFLIDTSDQLCLSGEEFKRCSIDTLFYVVGSPGMNKNFVELCLCSNWLTLLVTVNLVYNPDAASRELCYIIGTAS